MIEEYRSFLKGKSEKNFWKKAKQREYTHDPVLQITKDMTSCFYNLTTRSSITLRYLGLVINHGKDKLEISPAGNTFLNTPYKQKILDEQLMKVYLDCPELNAKISIKIIPLKAMLLIMRDIGAFSFQEYQMFVCWINEYQEISLAIALIKAFRKVSNKHVYVKVFEDKVQELGIDDFADNTKRFFDMLSISSYFNVKRNKTVIISPNLRNEDMDVILQSFNEENFGKENYYEYLINNDGWKVYSQNADFVRVIESLKQKTSEERENLVKEIVGKQELPDLESIVVTSVELNIAPSGKRRIEKFERISVKKINFEERDKQNRLSGDFAEEIVCKYERNRLTGLKLATLAQRVERVSLKSDSLGYDVVSFNSPVSERHIEVKAVKGGPKGSFRFFISENEIQTAEQDPNYYLYIVFDYLSKNPKVFVMPNPFINKIPGVTIVPTKYLVMIEVNNA